jgi:hypothetical protein
MRPSPADRDAGSHLAAGEETLAANTPHLRTGFRVQLTEQLLPSAQSVAMQLCADQELTSGLVRRRP